MKYLFLLLTIFLGADSIANKYVEFETVHLGNSLVINGLTVEFVKVLSDSRCPTNVQCIQAGEAKVTIKTTDKNKKSSLKEVVFSAKSAPISIATVISENEEVIIKVLQLLPYPQVPGKIPNDSYFIEVSVE